MTTELGLAQGAEVISTGKVEIDRRLGGGIPYRILMLVEGHVASGKSTLVQQLLWGALTAGEDAALLTTEQSVWGLIRQMGRLGMDVRDYFLLDHLQIYPIMPSAVGVAPDVRLRQMADYIAGQEKCRLVVIDALTTAVGEADARQLLEFLASCRTVCDQGRVIACTAHSDSFDERTLTVVRSVCDVYLRLQVQRSGSELLKTIEVAKIRGAEMITGSITAFVVEPGQGMRMVPISRAKA